MTGTRCRSLPDRFFNASKGQGARNAVALAQALEADIGSGPIVLGRGFPHLDRLPHKSIGGHGRVVQTKRDQRDADNKTFLRPKDDYHTGLMTWR
jgi:hypothetical protein